MTINITPSAVFRLRRVRRHAVGLVGALTLSLAATASALAATTIQFGAPSWPGVSVKTEVAAQLIQAMGFETKTQASSPAFIMSALKQGDLDVYLGGWMPTEKDMIESAQKTGKVKVLTKNISGAIMGLAVPEYVWNAGVHTEADLSKHADKFNKKIYGIERGSGFNQAIAQAISNDRHGLGGWTLVQTNASVMLSQVKRSIDRQKWVVFLGWQPHWMNIKYNMKYLKAVGKPKIADTRSDVLTVVNSNLVKEQPNITRFLRQFKVTIDQQSEWIYEYSQKKRKASDVASDWIGAHPEAVAKWLKNVKTSDGGSAAEMVRTEYGS